MSFRKRVDGTFRDVERHGVGYVQADEPESREHWISAAAASRLLEPVFDSEISARQTICRRAHAGLIWSFARRVNRNNSSSDNVRLPKTFWWAEGGNALEQNWAVGDFATSITFGALNEEQNDANQKAFLLRAFNVWFWREDIEKIIPAEHHAAPKQPLPDSSAGGRPPAVWWDDLWIEMCRQLYDGVLKPTKQADIETAMLQWLEDQDKSASTSTIRPRARKLWTAIKGEN